MLDNVHEYLNNHKRMLCEKWIPRKLRTFHYFTNPWKWWQHRMKWSSNYFGIHRIPPLSHLVFFSFALLDLKRILFRRRKKFSNNEGFTDETESNFEKANGVSPSMATIFNISIEFCQRNVFFFKTILTFYRSARYMYSAVKYLSD